MMVLFAGMAVGFAFGVVVAALLAAPAPDRGCDHCVLVQERTARHRDLDGHRLTA